VRGEGGGVDELYYMTENVNTELNVNAEVEVFSEIFFLWAASNSVLLPILLVLLDQDTIWEE